MTPIRLLPNTPKQKSGYFIRLKAARLVVDPPPPLSAVHSCSCRLGMATHCASVTAQEQIEETESARWMIDEGFQIETWFVSFFHPFLLLNHLSSISSKAHKAVEIAFV